MTDLKDAVVAAAREALPLVGRLAANRIKYEALQAALAALDETPEQRVIRLVDAWKTYYDAQGGVTAEVSKDLDDAVLDMRKARDA